MSQLQVSIIGAGISGLVLGRCLLQRGVQAVLFEKARHSPRRNDYGITLYSSTYGPLLKTLDIDDTSFRQQVAVDSAIGGFGNVGSKEHSCFRANRNRFEQLLSEGLDVRWEHEFERLEHSSSDEKGPGTIYFKKGKEHSSSVLVGADGPHSQVRSLVAADAKLQVLPFATYTGKRRVSSAEFEDKFAPAMQEQCVVEKQVSGALLQISISNRDKDEVSISYTFSRPGGKGANDQLYRPDRSKDAAKEMPEALFEEVGGLSELEEPFKSIFDAEALRKDRLLNWLMRSLHLNVETLGDAAEACVVLLGDAVHSEPILGGQGANVAIEDGMQLAEWIVEHQGTNLKQFYSSKSTRWENSVAESEGRIERMHATVRSSL